MSTTHGTALRLLDQRWQEVASGDLMQPEDIVRTLRSGRIELRRDNEIISMGADTTLLFKPADTDGHIGLEQFSGRVTISFPANGDVISIETPKLVAVVTGGSMSVTVSETGVKVSSSNGDAAVTFLATGAELVVAAGETLAVSAANQVVHTGADGSTVAAVAVVDAEGMAAVAATGETAPPVGDDANGNGNGSGNNGNGADNGNAGGNGNSNGNNGNSGNNGNGNGNGNGGGNSNNGNGNGNSGNSGNNGNGNGNSNSGNGNGNSGNGSGNGNGNGNSGNGNGNGNNK